MMNKKTLFLVLLLGVLVVPNISLAQVSLDNMVESIKDLLVNIASFVVVIGWVIAGILYLTAAGNPEKTGLAKKAMIAAAVGTVLVILASADIYGMIKSALNIGE